jgi:hypothetical protein
VGDGGWMDEVAAHRSRGFLDFVCDKTANKFLAITKKNIAILDILCELR